MSSELPIRTYSPEELRLLAAEGRLKGRGVERLTRLRSTTVYDRAVDQRTFACRL